MNRLSLDNFLGWIAGAGTVYVFWVLLNVLAGDGFSWFFFFIFWDIQFMLILILHKAYELRERNR